MGIPLVAGREFDDRLDRADSAPVAVVNESMAKRYWPDGDAVGRRIQIGGAERTVVGVSRDFRTGSLRDAATPQIYMPLAQGGPAAGLRTMTLVVRGEDPRTDVGSLVRAKIRELDPTLPVADVHPYEAELAGQLVPQRLGSALLGVFGLLCLALAAVGIYAVISYSVAGRTREIGIRMALGARPADVRTLVVAQSARPVGVGLALGLGLGAAAAFALRGFLFGVSPADPLTFVAVTAPARRVRAAGRVAAGAPRVEDRSRWPRCGRTDAMTTFLSDLRYAVRSLARSPGFAIAAIATLALGIGANTAVYSLVRGVLFRALPFAAPERLVALHETYPARGYPTMVASPPNYLDWKARSRSFSSMAAYTTGDIALSEAGEPERLRATMVTADFFETLGVAPAAGRTFAPDEFVSGRDQVVVLSHGVWQRRFGGDPAVVGRTVRLDGDAYRVAGVMPAAFRFPEDGPDAWVPLTFPDNVPTQRGAHYLSVIGRLKSGVTLEQANAELRGDRRRPRAAVPRHQRGPRRQRDAPARVPREVRAAGPADPARRGRLRHAHRVRQRRQPPADPGGAPRARSSRSAPRSAPGAAGSRGSS